MQTGDNKSETKQHAEEQPRCTLLLIFQVSRPLPAGGTPVFRQIFGVLITAVEIAVKRCGKFPTGVSNGLRRGDCKGHVIFKKIIILFHRGMKAIAQKYFLLICFDPSLCRDPNQARF